MHSSMLWIVFCEYTLKVLLYSKFYVASFTKRNCNLMGVQFSSTVTATDGNDKQNKADIIFDYIV